MSVALDEHNSVSAAATQKKRLKLALARVSARDAYSVWRRNSQVYLRLWKMELVAPLIEPFFMIFAFGWGVGALITAKVENVPYLSFVGAGVLAFAVFSRALFETCYGAYFRMVYQSTYDAILATPVNVESLAFAEVCWAVTKASLDAFVILFILAIFGAAISPLAILVPLPLVVASFFISGVSLGITAHIYDIDSYNLYLAVFFSMIFLCGAWFPIEVLPPVLRLIAWLIPLTSAIDLARAALVGVFFTRHIYEAVYLSLTALIAVEWALRALRRRMVT
jgi:lipooligosaccharide transport system permease protein